MRLKTKLFLILLAFFTSQAMAGNALDRRMDAATEVLEEMSKMPEKGVPSNLLASAYAVAVIPNVIKAGFVLGGSYGKGILVVRQPNGRWSNPAFISLGGGSIGWQAGAQSSDIVLVFKSRKGVDNIAQGKLTLGGDANVAAGPVGRHTSAATDGQLKAEIYSYARNRGLFAGISLKGSWLQIDQKANL
ncbi:MAG: lipid-binding SYLF domain-containing protein, partial [Gammaproteobacteria bacterium]|nr:lipid-binding SYLF domain-containing protein [Gammaproteobacteria bacterium]